jgi:hypothetical protein
MMKNVINSNSGSVLDLNELYNNFDEKARASKPQGHVFTLMDFFFPGLDFPEPRKAGSFILLKWDLPKDFNLPPLGVLIYAHGLLSPIRGDFLTGYFLKIPPKRTRRWESVISSFIRSIFVASKIKAVSDKDDQDLFVSPVFADYKNNKNFSHGIFQKINHFENGIELGSLLAGYSYFNVLFTEWRDDLIAQGDYSIFDFSTKKIQGGAYPRDFIKTFFSGLSFSPEFGLLSDYRILDITARPELLSREPGNQVGWLPVISSHFLEPAKNVILHKVSPTKKSLIHLETERNISRQYKRIGIYKKINRRKKKEEPVEILAVKTI